MTGPDSTLDLLTLSLLPDVGPRTVAELHARAPLRAVLSRPGDHGDLLGAEAREQLRSGDAGRRTEAVLGSGLDRIYPPENARLAAQVACSGAVVSEFSFGTGPHPGNFPRRNRVIAGWVRGVVVVEAAAKSGALVTARCALDEGREVMAVPGHPSQPSAEGTNALLRDGAAVVRGAADVAEE